MSTARTLLTAEEFDNYAFEEDKRYELDEGELVELTRPAYKHNRVVLRLTVKLFAYFESYPAGEALNPENLYAISASTRLAPDAAVILGDRRAELLNAKVIPIVRTSPSRSCRPTRRRPAFTASWASTSRPASGKSG